MLQKKNTLHIYLILSILSWVAFVLLSKDVAETKVAQEEGVFNHGNRLLINFFISAFFVFVFLYFKKASEKLRGSNFNEVIWNCFIIAAIVFGMLLVSRQFLNRADNNLFFSPAVYIDFINNINIIFIAVFCANTFYAFKRMILYQKSKYLLRLWGIFEILIFSLLIFNFINISITHPVVITTLGITAIIGLVLSLNMKWVAYLNFKQKWRSILLILLLFLIAASFIQYIYSESEHFGYLSRNFLINDLAQMVFIIGVIIFIVFYCLASILVILFNFPTSSVFEQKLGEVFNFQRLSQSIQMTEEEDQIYDVLLETSMSTVLADAAWLEIVNDKGHYVAFLNNNVEKYDIFELKKLLKKNRVDYKLESYYSNDIRKYKDADKLEDVPFRSVLTVPLFFQNKYLGLLGLIKNIPDSFNKEIIDVVNSFAGQASVSIENSRLMLEAIETERYKEEIKIARTVQKSLLPQQLEYDRHFQISAMSESADEVGGDYYDTFRLSDQHIAVVIADVSGHGTSAAFNMAQLKGIFQAIIQMNFSPDEALNQMNNALSRCLGTKTFITMSLLYIDTADKTIQFARAGHCPSIYYSNRTKEAHFLENKGLGLGILRSGDFKKYLEVFRYHYEEGDIILLYTDGIVEAKNNLNEEYGYDRLKTSLTGKVNMLPVKIVREVTNELYDFCGNRKPNDDYSCVAIKFV